MFYSEHTWRLPWPPPEARPKRNVLPSWAIQDKGRAARARTVGADSGRVKRMARTGSVERARGFAEMPEDDATVPVGRPRWRWPLACPSIGNAGAALANVGAALSVCGGLPNLG